MKKRILSMLLVLLMVMTLVPTMAFADKSSTDIAYPVTGGNIYFDQATGTITDCDQSVTEAVIPDEIEGVAVKFIGYNAFKDCRKLIAVTIPDSVATIGWTAFENCASLLSIVIPDSVTEIGVGAFEGCVSLSSVKLPNSLTRIENGMFKGCKRLTSIEIPDSVTSMGGWVFQNCSSLTNVLIRSDKLSSNGSLLFAGCTSLKSISLPKGSYYFNRMFQGCTSLENVNVASGIYASDYTFQGCTSLKSITLSGNIGQFAFEGCTSLEAINIPGNAREIGNSAFSGCTALKSVSLPLSLKTVGNAAFRYCNSLADVYYEGDSVQWGEISIDAYNEPLTNATLHQKEHVHSFGNPVVTAPNCTEQGFTTRTCKCGETTTDTYVDALGHEYKNGVCSRCGEREAHTHDFVETVTAPTCTEQGYTTYICSCGETYTKNYVSALGHKTALCNAVEPTCTEAGYTGDEVCTVCGEVISQGETIPATGHHFKGNTCPDCGETRSTADTVRAWFQESFNNMKNFFDKIFGRN